MPRGQIIIDEIPPYAEIRKMAHKKLREYFNRRGFKLRDLTPDERHEFDDEVDVLAKRWLAELEKQDKERSQ